MRYFHMARPATTSRDCVIAIARPSPRLSSARHARMTPATEYQLYDRRFPLPDDGERASFYHCPLAGRIEKYDAGQADDEQARDANARVIRPRRRRDEWATGESFSHFMKSACAMTSRHDKPPTRWPCADAARARGRQREMMAYCRAISTMMAMSMPRFSSNRKLPQWPGRGGSSFQHFLAAAAATRKRQDAAACWATHRFKHTAAPLAADASGGPKPSRSFLASLRLMPREEMLIIFAANA